MKRSVFLTVCVALLLTSCGGKSRFRVNVDLPSLGTQEMTVVYAVESGDRVILRVPSIDGKFEFEGSCSDTTMVEIFNAKKLFVAGMGVSNGMRLTLKSEGDSLFVEGGDVDVVRTLSVGDRLTSWPELGELELVVQHDSVVTVSPEGVWVFTSATVERSAAVMDSIRKYAEVDSVELRDVFVSADLSQWRMFTRKDSATWFQALMPDAPIALAGVLTSTPCLVEVDSAGVVLRVQSLP